MSESHSSKTWIAGAVIGPVAGAAIIACLVFLFHRKRKEPEPAKSHEQNYTTPPQELYTAPPELAASNSKFRHELSAYSYK